jgi:exopolyphosphatase/guanosine-5'-triphosphate,3'-diphosphate pyrophosphatase
MKLKRGAVFVGLGGTVRTLARVDAAARGYPLAVANGYELELARLEKIIARLRLTPVRQRAGKFPGLQADRADIILAGAVVVARALRRAGAKRLLVSGAGLREGLFFREFLRPRGAGPRDLRTFSVLNLARSYGYQQAHADHVTRLALSLFDQLQRQHGYGADERDWLWAAGQLHDIGLLIDYADHHQHSAYLILAAGLPGYTHREWILIALLCQYHRKGEPVAGPQAALLHNGDLARVRRLAALLRLAEYLDRSRAELVTSIRIRVTGRRARLTVHARTAAQARVEVWEAQRNAGLFEAAFGLKLVIEAG